MKAFNVRWESIFTAAAFAEAGEFETAREVLGEKATTTDTPTTNTPNYQGSGPEQGR